MPKTASSAIFSKLIGGRIREARSRRGLSQVNLARRLGVAPPYIAAVEAGRHNVTVGQLDAIAGALGIAVDVVFLEPSPEYPELNLNGVPDSGSV